jgi:hypothetical protein
MAVFNVIDTISRSTNVNPSTVSQDRTQPLLNNSGHCLENCTGSRLEFEDATTSANSTTSNPSYRIRPISTNYTVWRRILMEKIDFYDKKLFNLIQPLHDILFRLSDIDFCSFFHIKWF